jgi:hypothetical protein
MMTYRVIGTTDKHTVPTLFNSKRRVALWAFTTGQNRIFNSLMFIDRSCIFTVRIIRATQKSTGFTMFYRKLRAAIRANFISFFKRMFVAREKRFALRRIFFV